MSRHMRPLSNRLLSLYAIPLRRTLTTSSSEPSDSPKPILNHEETISSLKFVDDELLAAVQRHLTEHRDKAHELESIASQIQRSAAQVQLDPQLPPYTVLAWKKEFQMLPKQIAILQGAIEKAVLNVRDLQCIDYPADSRRSESEELRRQFIEGKVGGIAQQEQQFKHFQNEEEALKGRLRKKIERMRNELAESKSRAMIGKATAEPSFPASGGLNAGPNTVTPAAEVKSEDINKKRKSLKRKSLKQAVEEWRRAEQVASQKKAEQSAPKKKVEESASEMVVEQSTPEQNSSAADSRYPKDLATLCKELVAKVNTSPAEEDDATKDTSKPKDNMSGKEKKSKDNMTVKEKVTKVKQSLIEKKEGHLRGTKRPSGIGLKSARGVAGKTEANVENSEAKKGSASAKEAEKAEKAGKAETKAEEQPKPRMSLFERNKLLAERMEE